MCFVEGSKLFKRVLKNSVVFVIVTSKTRFSQRFTVVSPKHSTDWNEISFKALTYLGANQERLKKFSRKNPETHFVNNLYAL